MAELTSSLPQTRRPDVPSTARDDAANVGDVERWLSLLAGGALALYTLRRSLGSLVLACGAGALLYRGLRGQCLLYRTMGLSTAAHDAPSVPAPDVANIDEPRRIVLAAP